MNLVDLPAYLERMGVQERFFSIGEDKDEAVVAIRRGEIWECYFSERGKKVSLEFFAEESDVCRYFIQGLVNSAYDMGAQQDETSD